MKLYARSCDLLNIGIDEGYVVDGFVYSSKQIAEIIVKHRGFKNWKEASTKEPDIYYFEKFDLDQKFRESSEGVFGYTSDGISVFIKYE